MLIYINYRLYNILLYLFIYILFNYQEDVMVDVAEVVAAEGQVVVVHEAPVAVVTREIGEDSIVLPVVVRMIAATNGPETVPVGF